MVTISMQPMCLDSLTQCAGATLLPQPVSQCPAQPASPASAWSKQNWGKPGCLQGISAVPHLLPQPRGACLPHLYHALGHEADDQHAVWRWAQWLLAIVLVVALALSSHGALADTDLMPC